MRLRWLKILLTGLILLLVVTVSALYLPITYDPPTHSKPAQSYAEASARLTALQAKDEGLPLYSGCSSQFMTHGQKMERAIVLLHGYRSCPLQFQQLGIIFYEKGYNVVIPRMPHHGLTDVLTMEQAKLTTDELTAHVTEAVDIAQGLGEQVTVIGLSAGGVLTGWVAQNRADVKQAVLIAPVFGLHVIPAQLLTPATNLFLTLPNFFLWQDDELKANVPNPPQVYPQNSTRAISQILRLGFAVRTAANQSPPGTSAILVITNANDDAVDDQVTADIVTSWRKSGFKNLQTYEFKADLGLDHDLIDPAHPKEKVDLVYPVLIDLITGQEEP